MEETWDKYRNVVHETLELAKGGKTLRALDVLDHVLAEAIHENRDSCILALCKHGSVMALANGERDRQIRYEEMALPYSREYPFAAYNLAQLLLSDGQAVRAERYALEAFKLCVTGETQADRDLAAVILKQWPNFEEH